MAKFSLKINDNDYLAQGGDTLLNAILKCGSGVASPCGGNGTCNKCSVKILSNSQGLTNGKNYLACKIIVAGDMAIEAENFKQGELAPQNAILDTQTAQISPNSIAYCVDIGTTTIAFTVVDMATKDVIYKETFINLQVQFGADVISRIEYCRKNGVADLHNVLVSALNKHLLAHTFNANTISKIIAVGNTTMLHILLNYDCSSLGQAPYTPKFLGSMSVNARDIGINCDCCVTTLPCISAFVGADILAGLSCLTPPKKGYDILIDFGTNAEVVIFNSDKYLCTATAAGPCFEGGNISCGMAAIDSAITHFSLKNGVSSYQVLGDKTAAGICGTGIIDVIKELLTNGIIDKTGAFVDGDCYEVANGIAITQNDIRNFQLAKAAITAGVEVMAAIAKTDYSCVNKLYLSGGFSADIDIVNAVVVGLIPKELADKCVCIGNSAMSGACLALTQSQKVMDNIFKKSQYIDLATNALFFDTYINKMQFC